MLLIVDLGVIFNAHVLVYHCNVQFVSKTGRRGDKRSPIFVITYIFTGVLHQSGTELSFDEQTELNQAIVQKIQTKLPEFIAELGFVQQTVNTKPSEEDRIQQLRESLNEKLDTIQNQESKKVELMMEWIDHRFQDVSKFSENSCVLQTLKTINLDYKSE